MDLPVGPLPAGGQHLIELISRLSRCGEGADVTGLQTVADGQQIHTHPSPEIASTLGPATGVGQGQKPMAQGVFGAIVASDTFNISTDSVSSS